MGVCLPWWNATDFYWGKNFESYLRTKEDSIEVGQYAVLDLNSFALGKEKIIRLENGDSSYYGTHEVAKKKPNAYVCMICPAMFQSGVMTGLNIMPGRRY
jgi:hypothetical protein